MVKRNKNIEKLAAGYLFPEIGRRKKAFLEKNPDAKIISLGIGNTTEPLKEHIVEKLVEYCKSLGTKDGYTGYDDDQKAQDFLYDLKKKIATKWYDGIIEPEEIIVSDGSKPDCGRLLMLFGPEATVAVQDPAYPVYVDGSVIGGFAGDENPKTKQFDRIEYMSSKPENNFFPDLDNLKRTDLIYYCSPNNPTGVVSTKEQLKKLVDFAKKNKSIIIFDSAYSAFIKDSDLPKSIFEIEGAKEVAIEICSLSKPAGFTGVRLGWSIVPKELKFDDETPVMKDWSRIMSTLFNGASNIAQQGAIAALDDTGFKEIKETVEYYMKNAELIKNCLESNGFKTFGGDNSPYIWAQFPEKNSWEAFEYILNSCQIVTTPGSGFGPSGEGFLRFSAFGHREDIMEAIKRLEKEFSKTTSQ